MPQFRGAGKQATGIVFDSDFGASIDSVLALALLHGLEGKTEARIAALTVSSPKLEGAQLCDVIEKFYSSATTGQAAMFLTGTPVGFTLAGKSTEGSLVATALLSKKDESGKPVYAPRIRKLNDTAVPEILMRNALTAQADGNAVVVLAGPATNLVRLLDLTDGKDWIESKVKVLVLAEPDSALLADLPAAKRLLAEWPTLMIAVGREVGAALPFPGASIETDFAYNPAHPVAAAYRAYRPMPYDASTTAMAAALYAGRPKETYFKVSGPGTIAVADDGRTTFHSSSSGKHRYLIVDPSRKEEILKAYTTLASAKPVARTFRGPAAAADELKGDAVKVDGVKKEQP